MDIFGEIGQRPDNNRFEIVLVSMEGTNTPKQADTYQFNNTSLNTDSITGEIEAGNKFEAWKRDHYTSHSAEALLESPLQRKVLRTSSYSP